MCALLLLFQLSGITHTLENQYSALSEGVCCNILKLLDNFKLFFFNLTVFSYFIWRVHLILDLKFKLTVPQSLVNILVSWDIC